MNPNIQGIEPVPEITQLTLLAFLSSIVGLVENVFNDPSFRTTVHRVITRGNRSYLQQACGYLSGNKYEPAAAGRIFLDTHGIIGKAFRENEICRTRHYGNMIEFESDLNKDKKNVGEAKNFSDEIKSWLAIPLANSSDQVVLVVFAESKTFNFFANDRFVAALATMTQSLGELIAKLEESPLESVYNFEIQRHNVQTSNPSLYETIQQKFEFNAISRFKTASFNFDTTST